MTLAQATRTLRGLYQALLPKYPRARVSIQPYTEPDGYALLIDLDGQDIHRLNELEERYWGGSLRKED